MSSIILRREAGSMDADIIAKGMEMRKTCEGYQTKFILDVDETGILYGLLPKKTYLAHGENCKTVRGAKGVKSEDHMSAYICSNATG